MHSVYKIYFCVVIHLNKAGPDYLRFESQECLSDSEAICDQGTHTLLLNLLPWVLPGWASGFHLTEETWDMTGSAAYLVFQYTLLV